MYAKQLAILLLLPLVLFALPTRAYIGPGAGAGTIAVVLGILISIAMAFFAILWYPIKRLLKEHKAKKLSKQDTDSKSPDGSDEI